MGHDRRPRLRRAREAAVCWPSRRRRSGAWVDASAAPRVATRRNAPRCGAESDRYIRDMQTMRVLGTIALLDADGAELDALLRQPKHVALLACLALPRPGAWHRRDELLAALWPEH